jgi:hypothetical protein
MSLVLLQPGVNGTTRQPNADLTAITGDVVYSLCLQSQVVLDRPKETGYFPGREAHSTMLSAASERYLPELF